MYKQLGKAVVLIGIAATMMGNKGCDKKQAQQEPPRKLKYRTDVGQVTASQINLPGGGSFDFKFVANAQLYDVLNSSGDFSVIYNQPVASKTASIESQSLAINSYKLQSVNMFGSIPAEVECLINMPQVRVGGTVNSFEIESKAGLYIGFGPSGPFDVSGFPSVNVSVQKARLELSLSGYNPLSNTTWATETVTSKQTQVDINAMIDFGNFRLGPQYYYESPLSGVVKSALQKAVAGLAVDLDKNYGWYTRVLQPNDQYVTILGGKNLNIEVGDQFEIYNENHYWEDNSLPCKTKYRGGTPTTEKPIAIIEITNLGDDIADGKVIEQTGDAIDYAAKVLLHKLKDPPATKEKESSKK